MRRNDSEEKVNEGGRGVRRDWVQRRVMQGSE